MEKEERKGEMRIGAENTAPRPIIIDNWLKSILIFVLIIALGFLLINQTLGFFYKAEFLKSPCQLCGQLNPEVKTCIQNLNAPRPSYWTPDGWSDPFNEATSNYSLNP